jgi:hypothetical protein
LSSFLFFIAEAVAAEQMRTQHIAALETLQDLKYSLERKQIDKSFYVNPQVCTAYQRIQQKKETYYQRQSLTLHGLWSSNLP